MINLKRTLLALSVIFLLVAGSFCLAKSVSAEPPIRLKAAFFCLPHHHFCKGQVWFLEQVETRSKGRVVFERYWGGSLVSAKDIPDALAGGIADVGTILPGYYPGKFPLGTIGSTPGINYHQWPCLMAFYETYQQVAELREECERRGIRMLTPIAYGPYYIWSKKKIKDLNDLKGLKIRSIGDQARLIAALGATPVSIVPPEIYDAIQKGTIDGAVGDCDLAVPWGFHRVSKYFNLVPIGTCTCFLGISTRTWNKLPADIRKIMEDIVPDAIKAWARIYEVEGLGKYEKIAKSEGVEIVPISAEEETKVLEISKKHLWDKWIADMESKGLAGRKVFETYINAIKKNVQLDPMKYE